MIRSSSASGVWRIFQLDGPRRILFVSNVELHWCLGMRGGFIAWLLNHAGGRVCCGGLCSLLGAGGKTHLHGVRSEDRENWR